MSEIAYQYTIDYLTPEGAHLGAVPVEPDWGPARECAQFLAVRRGVIPPVLRDGVGAVEPVWDAAHGAPVTSAVRIVVAAEAGDGSVCEEVPSSDYFRRLAQRESQSLVDRGLLARGDLYRFRVCAYPSAASHSDTPDAAGRFDVEEVGDRLRLGGEPIDGFLPGAAVRGAGSDAADLRVFVPRRVIDEALTASRASGGVETGGVLVGGLNRCPASGEVFLAVSAQIEAAHTETRASRLTFTAESWAAARAAIALRRRDEIMCGWWHFHPDFCRTCPDERRQGCRLSHPFFSAEDVHMHRTVFPRAFQIALLVSDRGGEALDVSLYGWRRGMVVSRGFHVFEEAARTSRAAS